MIDKPHPEFTNERRLALAHALATIHEFRGERNTAIYIDDIAVHMHPTGKVRVFSLRPRYMIASYDSVVAMAEEPK